VFVIVHGRVVRAHSAVRVNLEGIVATSDTKKEEGRLYYNSQQNVLRVTVVSSFQAALFKGTLAAVISCSVFNQLLASQIKRICRGRKDTRSSL
jgi:hypothetical protein